MVAPLYNNYKNLEFKKLQSPHCGLWFERFFNGYEIEDEHWQLIKPNKKTHNDVKRDWILSVIGQDEKVGNADKLTAFKIRHDALLKGLAGESRCYSTDWHFVTGMGNAHPVENGFSWHSTLAVPYLAGSAVKGLVRAWLEFEKAEIKMALKKLESIDDEAINQEKELLTRQLMDLNKRLITWFGTEDKKDIAEQSGEFIFFDAVPCKPPQLVCDIMTPHFGKWYELGDTDNLTPDIIPADWHEPVPVPFLAVKKARFVFSIAPRCGDNKAELTAVFEALHNALLWLGAGAKTAAGYGYMTRC